MCSINGIINLKRKLVDYNKINKIINVAEERGKSSFGCYIENVLDFTYTKKFLGKPSDKSLEEKFQMNPIPLHSPYILLNNNRAEPTNEFVENKTDAQTQPFSSENNVTVHNGTIANDKELKKKYNIETAYNIDSEVLPYLFELCDSNEDVRNMLANEIKGSYALVNYDKKHKKVFIAANYKPLYIMIEDGVLYFSSLGKYFGKKDYDFKSNSQIKAVKPYTLLVLDLKKEEFEFDEYSLYPDNSKEKDKKKALIIASSGMDSTVAASWALNEGYDIELLHFKYDAIAQGKEEEHIKQIADYFKCQLSFIPINFYKDIIGGSTLYDGGEINKENEGESGTELALEWVPARNLVFFSIATAFAEAHNIDYIILGGNLEESGCLLDIPENAVRLWHGGFKMPSEVEVGDYLRGYNFNLKQQRKVEVEKVFQTEKEFYYEIIFDDEIFMYRENFLAASAEHPFFSITRNDWVETKDIKPGEVLMGMERNRTVKEVRLIKKRVMTYNYLCKSKHNFFIGDEATLTHNSYPDNEQIFQMKFNDIIPNAVGYNKQVEVLAPLGSLMKKDIVELGLKLNAPLHLTWSCYDNKELHCGECGPCYMRKKAFKMLGEKEVIKYLNEK